MATWTRAAGEPPVNERSCAIDRDHTARSGGSIARAPGRASRTGAKLAHCTAWLRNGLLVDVDVTGDREWRRDLLSLDESFTWQFVCFSESPLFRPEPWSRSSRFCVRKSFCDRTGSGRPNVVLTAQAKQNPGREINSPAPSPRRSWLRLWRPLCELWRGKDGEPFRGELL